MDPPVLETPMDPLVLEAPMDPPVLETPIVPRSVIYIEYINVGPLAPIIIENEEVITNE
jgi:hypothetical protein